VKTTKILLLKIKVANIFKALREQMTLKTF